MCFHFVIQLHPHAYDADFVVAYCTCTHFHPFHALASVGDGNIRFVGVVAPWSVLASGSIVYVPVFVVFSLLLLIQ